MLGSEAGWGSPNKTLQRTGHATDGRAHLAGPSRVSRLLSVVVRGRRAATLFGRKESVHRIALRSEVNRHFLCAETSDQQARMYANRIWQNAQETFLLSVTAL